MNPMYELVADVLATEFRLESSRISPETAFRDLNFDSLSMVNLSLFLSDRLGVVVEDEEVFKQETVDDLVNMLEDMEIGDGNERNTPGA